MWWSERGACAWAGVHSTKVAEGIRELLFVPLTTMAFFAARRLFAGLVVSVAAAACSGPLAAAHSALVGILPAAAGADDGAGSAVSPLSLDVTCKNAASDAALLNAAIAGSGDGGAVHIHGTCLLTAPVVLLGGRSYIGDSRTGTVLRQGSGSWYVRGSKHVLT